MTLKPLADRVVIKQVKAEEKTKRSGQRKSKVGVEGAAGGR